jgi:hypothetical protein
MRKPLSINMLRSRLPRSPQVGRGSLIGLLLLASWSTAKISTGESDSGPDFQAVPEAVRAGASENEVHYTIDARLEDGSHILHGEETVVWTNNSGEAVSDLWFHTYLNAFANTESTHLTESEGEFRGEKAKDGWGWMRIESISVGDAALGEVTDVGASMTWQAREDGNEQDRTVFSVDLLEPVADGGSITINIEWESQLPRVRRRTGYKDDFILAAHWFPKLGVYQAGKGWSCHQFHMNTEFFSDYGTYDVTLNFPERYEDKVRASGVKTLDRLIGDGRYMVKFKAPSDEDREEVDRTGKLPRLHDFTWTADPKFLVKEFSFNYSDWKKRFPGEVDFVQGALGSDRDLELGAVRVTVMIHPEREDQAERHAEATMAALFFYGLWFGEYPYEHVTVVDPAWGARAAGGMEYPTLFTCGTELGTEPDMYSPESVTVHECGHQFWYGLVGNNESENAWLDEGFNSYTDSEVLWRTYGAQRSSTSYSKMKVYGTGLAPLQGGGRILQAVSGRRYEVPEFVPILKGKAIEPLGSSGLVNWWREQPLMGLAPEETDPRWGDRTGYLRDAWIDEVDTPVWEYANSASYRTNSYPRPAVILRSLEGLVNRDVFLRGMRHYAETWRYKHPTPDDFFAAFNEGAGVDMDWYFEELFRGTGTVDWAVSVSSKALEAPRGMYQGESGVWAEREETDDDATGHRAKILVTREGQLSLPLEIRVTFEGDKVENRIWTREEQLAQNWIRLEFEETSRVISVELDPNGKWYLDKDMSNNQWFKEKDEVAPVRWGERIFSRFVHSFHWQMGIGG